MAINFPLSPTLNQTHTVGSKTWYWNGSAWNLFVIDVTPITITANLGFTQANTAFDRANTAYAQANASYTYASSTANNAYITANNAWVKANAANTIASSAYNTGNGAYNTANVAWAGANASYTYASSTANNAYNTANAAWAGANASYTYASSTANNAYNTANAAWAGANAAYTYASSTANNAYITANNAWAKANAANTIASSAYDNSNSAYNTANSAWAGANASYIYASSTANNAYNTANAAWEKANVANTIASSAYDNSNSAYNNANSAYDKANSAFILADFASNVTFPLATNAFNNAGSAYNQANSAYNNANSAYNNANSAYDTANSAWAGANNSYKYASSTANNAYNTANNAWSTANASYNTANTKTFTFYQSTAPTSANSRDLWTNSDTGVVYENFGTTSSPVWAEFGPTGTIANNSPGIISASNIIVSYTPPTTINAGIQISAANTKGGVGYADVLQFTNISGGSTNPNKYIRITSAGELQVVNSAYQMTPLSLTDGGDLTLAGNTTINGISPGYAPNRPAFKVSGNGGSISATTTVSGGYMVVDYNQGSYLNTTTGIFTAPVAGLYQVNVLVRTQSNANPSINQIIIRKTAAIGGTVTSQIMVEFGVNTTMNHAGGSAIVKMAVGDTLKFDVTSGTISFDGNDNWSVAYIG